MNTLSDTLVCFAVKQEAKPFARSNVARAVRVLLTGMGPANARRAIEAELTRQRPRLVISGGFAGGLTPGLGLGTVLFTTAKPELGEMLKKSGARPARFHCAERVAATAGEKRALREQTDADAVEMESGIICDYCIQQGIPNAVVRVILDPAAEDLPLDFNALMNSRQEIASGKLALALLRQPHKVPTLLRFGRRSAVAARALAQVLRQFVGFTSCGS